MLTLLAAVALAAPPVDSSRPNPAAPVAAIQISLNNDGSYAPSGRVTVRVQTNDDGYLVVFRVDGDGHVRVLFPLDPEDDAFVGGGKAYELRGRDDRETFLADDRSGTGMVYAAISKRPLEFRDFVINGHWDYDALRLSDSTSDAETDLTALVTRMTSRARFDYDALGYRVQEIGTVAAGGGDGGGYYPGYYDPAYDPSWRCLGCGWGYPGSDVSVGLNFGYSPFGDPFLFSPWGYSYDSGYGYGYGYGYGRGYGYRPGNYWFPGTYPVAVNRHPLPPGSRPRPRPGMTQPPAGTRVSGPPSGVSSRPPRPSEGSAPPAARRPSEGSSAGSAGTRARPRPADMNMPVRTGNPGYSRPAFREPPPSAPRQVDRQREPQQSRPVYREPPRGERAPSPPPRVERAPSSPPPQRSAPAERSRPEGHRP